MSPCWIVKKQTTKTKHLRLSVPARIIYP